MIPVDATGLALDHISGRNETNPIRPLNNTHLGRNTMSLLNDKISVKFLYKEKRQKDMRRNNEYINNQSIGYVEV